MIIDKYERKCQQNFLMWDLEGLVHVNKCANMGIKLINFFTNGHMRWQTVITWSPRWTLCMWMVGPPNDLSVDPHFGVKQNLGSPLFFLSLLIIMPRKSHNYWRTPNNILNEIGNYPKCYHLSLLIIMLTKSHDYSRKTPINKSILLTKLNDKI